jgi:hypothetical protein
MRDFCQRSPVWSNLDLWVNICCCCPFPND